MTLIRTTMNPGNLLDVGDAELEWLTRWGLVFAAGDDLYSQWLAWPEGPTTQVSGVTVRITDNTSATVLPTQQVAAVQPDGRYVYRWPATAQSGVAPLTAHWTAQDQFGNTLTALHVGLDGGTATGYLNPDSRLVAGEIVDSDDNPVASVQVQFVLDGSGELDDIVIVEAA
jgi:hypothetical protein